MGTMTTITPERINYSSKVCKGTRNFSK